MPYLRFSRDKRGYENTYVLYAGRTRGKSQPRMLYWFRTPPNVKVGRLALDPEAIRAVEDNNPDVSFDWNKMLKVRPTPKVEPGTSARRGRKRKQRPAQPEQSRERSEGGAPTIDSQPQATVDDSAEPLAPDQPLPPIQTDAPEVDPQLLEAEAHLEEAVELGDDWEASTPGGQDDGEHPVVTLMGHETLARLRARYAEIQARIMEKPAEADDLEEIRSLAETLNPDRWTTIEAAVTGIERFEADVEAVKARLGRRPPRSRRLAADSDR